VISGALLALWNDANGITALATAVIAGFTATLWINSSNQLDRMREIERAYLVGGGDIITNQAGENVFRLDVANHGKTAAKLLDYDIQPATWNQVQKPGAKARQPFAAL
jgi:hypothetical protein